MNKAKSKLNVKLLRRVKKHILAEPRRLLMRKFIINAKPGVEIDGDDFFPQEVPECGTVACIAGWAIILDQARVWKDENGYPRYWSAGKRVLNLKESQAERLFVPTLWPTPFRIDYDLAASQKDRAKIAAARIEHLIKTGE